MFGYAAAAQIAVGQEQAGMTALVATTTTALRIVIISGHANMPLWK
jgi:hypothetical protein